MIDLVEKGLRSIDLHQLILMIEEEEEIKELEEKKIREGIAHLIGIVEEISHAGLEIILASKYSTLAPISYVPLAVR